MSNFIDTPISQGTRKKVEYDDAQRSRLVLSIERTDGGTLQIPFLDDAKATRESYLAVAVTALKPRYGAAAPGHDAARAQAIKLLSSITYGQER